MILVVPKEKVSHYQIFFQNIFPTSVYSIKHTDMGYFSWKTCDTDRSIANNDSDRETFEVHMIAPDGRTFTETDYEGFGIFGNKDFYELLAELNGLGTDRSAGIDLCFKNNPSGDDTIGVIYPKLVEDLAEDVEGQYSNLPNPTSCEDQGFFYSNDEDEDEDDEDNFQDDESWGN